MRSSGASLSRLVASPADHLARLGIGEAPLHEGKEGGETLLAIRHIEALPVIGEVNDRERDTREHGLDELVLLRIRPNKGPLKVGLEAEMPVLPVSVELEDRELLLHDVEGELRLDRCFVRRSVVLDVLVDGLLGVFGVEGHLRHALSHPSATQNSLPWLSSCSEAF